MPQSRGIRKYLRKGTLAHSLYYLRRGNVLIGPKVRKCRSDGAQRRGDDNPRKDPLRGDSSRAGGDIWGLEL